MFRTLPPEGGESNVAYVAPTVRRRIYSGDIIQLSANKHSFVLRFGEPRDAPEANNKSTASAASAEEAAAQNETGDTGERCIIS